MITDNKERGSVFYLFLMFNKKNNNLKRLWNMKGMLLPIVVGELGTVPKSFKKEWRNWKLEEKMRLYRPLDC